MQGTDLDKVSFLFNLVDTNRTGFINQNSHKLLQAIEILTFVPSVAVGEIVSKNYRFSSSEEQE
jgi:hypothetical protein